VLDPAAGLLTIIPTCSLIAAVGAAISGTVLGVFSGAGGGVPAEASDVEAITGAGGVALIVRVGGVAGERVGGVAGERERGLAAGERVSGLAEERVSGLAEESASGLAEESASGPAGERVSGAAGERVRGLGGALFTGGAATTTGAVSLAFPLEGPTAFPSVRGTSWARSSLGSGGTAAWSGSGPRAGA
jgi:hypothetical protein